MRSSNVLRNISVAIVIVLSLNAAIVCYWIWFDVREEQEIDLANTSSILKRYYELAFFQRELGLINVGRRMLEITGPDEIDRRMDVGMKALDIYDELLAFGLTRPDGSMILFTGDVATAGVPNLMNSELTRRSFLEALKSKGISIGEPYYFEQVQDWVLPIRVPIYEDDSLIALNTSAIQYQSLVGDLEDFGINKDYRVHEVNTTFNTTQMYYPLEESKYEILLSQNAEIYSDIKEVGSIGEFSLIEGYNNYENYPFLGVRAVSNKLARSITVSVNKAVMVDRFWVRARFVFLAYLLIGLFSIVTLNYLRRKEDDHQQEIQTERANLVSLFESTNSIVGLFDTNKRIIAFNKSFADYAKTTDDIDLEVGMDAIAKIKNKDIAKIFTEFQDRALKGEKFKETVEYPSPVGTLYFLMSYNPIYKDDKVVGISMFVDDITELKNSQKELEKYSEQLEQLVNERTLELKSANRSLKKSNKNLNMALDDLKETQSQLIQSEKMASLGVLAAGVGHEINNPLNFIQGGVAALKELVNSKNYDNEKVDFYINVIEEGVRRCAAITESLSNYSRQGGDLNENCDIHAILDNCLLILGGKLKSKVKLKKEYSKEHLMVQGNEGKLHQVFLNIITNAEQSIEKTGVITLGTKVEDSHVLITVEDTGTGIKNEDIKKIGDPFFTTKAPGKGTGLGLSIAYSIIDEHGGSIECSSIENRGTIFTVKLPINDVTD